MDFEINVDMANGQSTSRIIIVDRLTSDSYTEEVESAREFWKEFEYLKELRERRRLNQKPFELRCKLTSKKSNWSKNGF